MSTKNLAKSKADEVKLPYGLKDGKLVHISEVPKGLACGCVCPGCSAPLEAHKGTRKAHHFQHHSKKNCEGALETALHLLAKEILEQCKTFVLPPLWAQPFRDLRAVKLHDAREVKVDRVLVEQPYKDIKPDLIVKAGRESFMLEVFVTHKVDDEKIEKLRKYQCPAIEIDLSTIPRDLPREEIEKIVVSGIEKKAWLNSLTRNKAEQEMRIEVRKMAQQRKVQVRVPRRRLNRYSPRL